MSTAAQIAANRKNSHRSTGPKTEEGKAAAAHNHLRHGLRGQFTILPNEDAEAFTSLLASLGEEHQPGTITEQLLVTRMAEHEWLSRRAQTLIDQATLDIITTDKTAEPSSTLSLWLRYQTTHHRGFHKCLADLLRLRNEKRKEQIGFERQKHQQAENDRREQVAEARARALNAQATFKELDTEMKAMLHFSFPDNVSVQFEKLKPFLNFALENYIKAQTEGVL